MAAERLVRAAGFEVRVALGEPDPQTDGLFKRALRRTQRRTQRRTPAQLLADATRSRAHQLETAGRPCSPRNAERLREAA